MHAKTISAALFCLLARCLVTGGLCAQMPPAGPLVLRSASTVLELVPVDGRFGIRV